MISKSRRSFIRLAAGTVGATVATSMLPSSIQAALAIPRTAGMATSRTSSTW